MGVEYFGMGMLAMALVGGEMREREKESPDETALGLAERGARHDVVLGLGLWSQSLTSTTTTMSEPLAANVQHEAQVVAPDNDQPPELNAQDNAQHGEQRGEHNTQASLEEEVWYLKDITFRPDPAAPPKRYKIITQNYNG